MEALAQAAKSLVAANVWFPPIAAIRLVGHYGRMSDPSQYAGMTVNERLFTAGLLDAYDAAKKAKDRAEMVRLLTEVDLDNAAWSADTSLGRSENHGR